jgi:preprotein translocase subunit SecA
MFEEIAGAFATQAQIDPGNPENDHIGSLIAEVQMVAPVTDKTMREQIRKHDELGLSTYILDTMKKAFAKKEKEYGSEVWFDVVRFMFISTLDTLFTQHLTSIDDLREGIGLRRHAQLDPLVQYKNEAFMLFEQLLRAIGFEGTRRIQNVQVELNTPLAQKEQEGLVFESAGAASAIDVATGKLEEEKAAKKKKVAALAPKKEKLGRNDSCWCGSGKKYKKCHMIEDEAKSKHNHDV